MIFRPFTRARAEDKVIKVPRIPNVDYLITTRHQESQSLGGGVDLSTVKGSEREKVGSDPPEALVFNQDDERNQTDIGSPHGIDVADIFGEIVYGTRKVGVYRAAKLHYA